MVKVLHAVPQPGRRTVGIAVARFNEVVTERLLQGALQTLREHGVADDDVTVLWVPGAFELPQACQWLARVRGCSALVMLGAVVKGGTDHYHYVCDGVSLTIRKLRAHLRAKGIESRVVSCGPEGR